MGSIRNNQRRLRAAAAVAGVGLVTVAVYVYLHQPGPSSTAAGQLPSLSDKKPTPPKSSPVNTETLISIIKEKQHQTVGDSTGTLDYQCFTDAKLAEFHKTNVPNQLASQLKKEC